MGSSQGQGKTDWFALKNTKRASECTSRESKRQDEKPILRHHYASLRHHLGEMIMIYSPALSFANFFSFSFFFSFFFFFFSSQIQARNMRLDMRLDMRLGMRLGMRLDLRSDMRLDMRSPVLQNRKKKKEKKIHDSNQRKIQKSEKILSSNNDYNHLNEKLKK